MAQTNNKRQQQSRTFPGIPRQMAQPIPEVEREWEREEGFSGDLDGIWHARYKADDVRACEGQAHERGRDVRDGETV